MKKDMGKCVLERPRRGSNRRCAKAREFGKFVKDDEGQIEYEGITRIPVSWKKYGWDHREFSDVLGPIEGYLRSSCGRLWNDVYSEIARVLGNAGYALGHIITDHLNVETTTYRDNDGNLWACNKNGIEELSRFYYRSKFYVEPETGILRETPRKRYRHRPAEIPDVVILSNNSEYRKISGIWYYRTYELIDEAGPIQRGRYGLSPIRDRGQFLLWEKKRQLGKKQLKELGLKNG